MSDNTAKAGRPSVSVYHLKSTDQYLKGTEAQFKDFLHRMSQQMGVTASLFRSGMKLIVNQAVIDLEAGASVIPSDAREGKGRRPVYTFLLKGEYFRGTSDQARSVLASWEHFEGVKDLITIMVENGVSGVSAPSDAIEINL